MQVNQVGVSGYGGSVGGQQIVSGGAVQQQQSVAAPQPGREVCQHQCNELQQGFQQLGQGWQNFAGSQTGQAQGGAAPIGAHPVNVAVIDDFNSSHGAEISDTLHQAGANTSAYNINVPGQDRTTMIANALDDVARRLQNGEPVDAINLSQQDFQNGPAADRVRQAIAYIQSNFGVPVVVAAGNGGANDLAPGAALVAASGQADSAPGNITAFAPTTSFSTAVVAAQAARLKNQGLDLNSIVGGLQQQAFNQGGSL